MSDLECKVCDGSGTLTVPDLDRESASEQACPDPVHDGTVTATPGQALSPDPADFAYHVRATAFNVLTGKMAGDEWHVPRSERDAIASAIVEAIEPLIRADERALAAQEPQPAPELAAAMRESRLRAEVITEILDAFSPSGSGHTARVGMVQIAKWRTRAGLTS